MYCKSIHFCGLKIAACNWYSSCSNCQFWHKSRQKLLMYIVALSLWYIAIWVFFILQKKGTIPENIAIELSYLQYSLADTIMWPATLLYHIIHIIVPKCIQLEWFHVVSTFSIFSDVGWKPLYMDRNLSGPSKTSMIWLYSTTWCSTVYL